MRWDGQGGGGCGWLGGSCRELLSAAAAAARERGRERGWRSTFVCPVCVVSYTL